MESTAGVFFFCFKLGHFWWLLSYKRLVIISNPTCQTQFLSHILWTVGSFTHNLSLTHKLCFCSHRLTSSADSKFKRFLTIISLLGPLPMMVVLGSWLSVSDGQLQQFCDGHPVAWHCPPFKFSTVHLRYSHFRALWETKSAGNSQACLQWLQATIVCIQIPRNCQSILHREGWTIWSLYALKS